MTLEELNTKVRDWDQRGTSAPASAKYSTILDQLSYYAKEEWRDYVPAMHSNFTQSYMDRLAAWVGNATNETDEMLLLEYASYISYFSHADFQALYRTAMHREVYRWVADKIGARLGQPPFQRFHDEVYAATHEQTWFCPVTDSMDINEFYKANHLQGVGHRPGFATLEMLAERAGTPDPLIVTNLNNYMANPRLSLPAQPSLERIVLLEDIVGSASQCMQAVQWSVANLGKPILFVPLILCPNGVQALRDLEANSAGVLTVRPVVELRRGDILGPERQGDPGWPISDVIECLAIRSRLQVGLLAGQEYGWDSTGCSLATFSNTPDNTLPMVWKQTAGTWNALFPRIYRGMI